MTNKTIAIIGGGPAGLTSAKAALECGMQPHIFDANDTIGGLWRPKNGLVWQGMCINLSHYSCCFSDLGWPDDAPDFPDSLAVYNYLLSYAQLNQLTPYIHGNARVIAAAPKHDQVDLTWLEGATERQKTFHHLVVANGIFNRPFRPAMADHFRGKTLHSADYNDGSLYKDRHVAIIGGSFTGMEIATDLARHGAQVTFIFRKPVWILSRLTQGPNGNQVPIDLLFHHRVQPDDTVPAHERYIGTSQFFESQFGNPGDTHEDLRMHHDGTPPHVAVSDDFLDHVISGAIILKKGQTLSIGQSGPIIEGHGEQQVDDVIFCTGYQADLDFLNPPTRATLNYAPDNQLVPFISTDGTTHPDIPNLGFVGVYRSPYFGIMELQARMLMMQFSGMIRRDTTHDGIAFSQHLRRQKINEQFPYGGYVTLSDRFAHRIGVLDDTPALEGPIIPAHYRLNGPFKNPDAAKPVIAAASKRYNGP